MKKLFLKLIEDYNCELVSYKFKPHPVFPSWKITILTPQDGEEEVFFGEKENGQPETLGLLISNFEGFL